MTTSPRRHTIKAVTFSVKAVTFSVLIMLGLTLSSCLDDNTSAPEVVTYATLYHGSPNTGGVDIYLDDNKVNSSSFDYADYSGYAYFTPGERTFGFSLFGTNTEVADVTATFEQDKFYSIFLAGELADAEVIILTDTASQFVSGKAHVRIINLSPDAGPIDLFIGDHLGDPVITSVEFKEATEFKYVDAVTSSDLQIFDSDTDEVLTTLEDVSLVAGSYYTVIVRGYQAITEGDTKLTVQLETN